MPEAYGGGDGDVEGVLGAALGYFEAEVTAVDNGLGDAIDFVAYHEGIFFVGFRVEIL